MEYVGSGTSHTRILNIAATEDKEINKLINGYFSSLQDKNNHKFSLLYNAFTEKDFGRKFKEFYKSSLHTIHADSGGLQLITQGKTITDALKYQVYKNQAESSDIAMSFDEIPIGVVGERSGRNDTTNRFFDKDRLEHFARLSGKNLKRQIEVFQEEKTTSKPLLIAQGNDYDSYMFWVEYLLKELPDEYKKSIGGIAMGAAALGTGILEDMERAVYSAQLPLDMEEPYIHILGVGSIRRLLPYIALAHSGYFPKNLHLSYDSTTHTSGLSVGIFFIDDANLSINRNFSIDYETIFRNVNEYYNLDKLGINVKSFHEMVNSNSSFYMKNNVIDKDKMILYYNSLMGFICSSVANFTNTINNSLTSEKKLLKIAHKAKVSRDIGMLLGVKNIDDFLKWKSTHSFATRSQRISADKPTSLDSFFGE